MTQVDLSKFNNDWYSVGRGRIIQLLWYFCNVLFLQNPFNPLSGLKIIVLRLFGAKIGKGVVIKPAVNVKYPWFLEIGNNSWIGERVWLDSLAQIKIGQNVCISQGVYLCTGNHDWSDEAFGLTVGEITIDNGVWVGARSVVLPHVRLASHSVVTAGAIVSRDTEAYQIYGPYSCSEAKTRVIKG